MRGERAGAARVQANDEESLRAAVARSSATTVVLITGPITLTISRIGIHTDVTLRGADCAGADWSCTQTVRGAGDTHLFQVYDGAVVSFENLHFTNVRRPRRSR